MWIDVQNKTKTDPPTNKEKKNRTGRKKKKRQKEEEKRRRMNNDFVVVDFLKLCVLLCEQCTLLFCSILCMPQADCKFFSVLWLWFVLYAGFGGDNCEEDIDECKPYPCSNNAMCVDGVNSYQCICQVCTNSYSYQCIC